MFVKDLNVMIGIKAELIQYNTDNQSMLSKAYLSKFSQQKKEPSFISSSVHVFAF